MVVWFSSFSVVNAQQKESIKHLSLNPHIDLEANQEPTAIDIETAMREYLGLSDQLKLSEPKIAHTHGFTLFRFFQMMDGRQIEGSSLVARVTPLIANRPRQIDWINVDLTNTFHVFEPTPDDVLSPLGLATKKKGVRALLMGGEAYMTTAWEIMWGGEPFELYFHGKKVLMVRALRWHQQRGRVFSENPVTTPNLDEVELTNLPPNSRVLSGTKARMISPAPARANAEGHFFYEPQLGTQMDPFAEVMGYHHVNRAMDYFSNNHGYTYQCRGTFVLPVFVNDDVTTGAAYYSPIQASECASIHTEENMGIDYAYDSEVVVHEFTHSVTTEQLTLFPFGRGQYGPFSDPGALSEGISDYYAATLSGNPTLGEYSLGSESGRTADNNLKCPNSLQGQRHHDGQLISASGWDVRELVGREIADELMYMGFIGLGSQPTIAEWTAAYKNHAQALRTMGELTQEQVDAISALLDNRGMTDCEPVITLEDGDRHSGFTGYLLDLFTGMVEPTLLVLHYRVQLPMNATRLVVNYEDNFGGLADYTVYARANSRIELLGGSIVRDLKGTTNNNTLTVQVDGTTFKGGDVVYLAATGSLNHQFSPESRYTVSVDIRTDGRPVFGDAGVNDAGTQDASQGDAGAMPPDGRGGCCHVHARSVPGMGFVTLGSIICMLMLKRRRQ